MSTTAENLPALTGYDRLIEAAVNSDAVDVGKLEQLLDIKQRHEADEAKKLYFEAMRVVQSAGLQIKRDAKNTQTNSAYAKLESINRKLVPVYTDAGFSLSFSEEKAEREGHIRVSCDIYHSAGHLEHKWAELPLDNVGLKGNANKTDTHATGSTFSYARRYLTLMIFNLNTGDDDDGQAAGAGLFESIMIHNEALRERKNLESVAAIKSAFERNDYAAAVEAYFEISDDDKNALRLAWTKGGMFTPEETKKFKSDEWSAARKAHFGTES